jgi:hypothetical protein
MYQNDKGMGEWEMEKYVMKVKNMRRHDWATGIHGTERPALQIKKDWLSHQCSNQTPSFLPS